MKDRQSDKIAEAFGGFAALLIAEIPGCPMQKNPPVLSDSKVIVNSPVLMVE